MTVPTSRGTELKWTGLGPVPAEVQGFFDQVLLDNLPPDFVYKGFGLKRNIPPNAGRYATWDRPELLSVDTTPIPEYESPDGQQFSTATVQGMVVELGTHVPFSRRATELGLIRDLTGKIRDTLTIHKKDCLDQYTRDQLVAGTQLRYANGTGSARTDVGSKVKAADIQYAVNLLVRANNKTITKRIEPSTGQGTLALNPGFVCFCHWDAYKTLAAMDGWLDVADYPSGARYPNEIGTIRGERNVRFIASSNGKIWAGGGADVGTTGLRSTGGKIDVYAMVIIAEGAYIESGVNGKGLGVVVQPLGSGGPTDPFKSRGSIGWADYTAATISDDARLVRIEHGCEVLA